MTNFIRLLPEAEIVYPVCMWTTIIQETGTWLQLSRKIHLGYQGVVQSGRPRDTTNVLVSFQLDKHWPANKRPLSQTYDIRGDLATKASSQAIEQRIPIYRQLPLSCVQTLQEMSALQ